MSTPVETTVIAGERFAVEADPQRTSFLRTDMTLVTLVYNGDDALIFDKVEGGGRDEPLTLYRMRRSDDAADIVHLIGLEEPVEVICQPMNGHRELTGLALVYQGILSRVHPDILDAEFAELAYLTVTLDEWAVRER